MARLLGSGSKGTTRTGVKGAGGLPPQVNMLDPSQSGNPDVVQQRNAQATQGVMQKNQLKANKSAGIARLL